MVMQAQTIKHGLLVANVKHNYIYLNREYFLEGYLSSLKNLRNVPHCHYPEKLVHLWKSNSGLAVPAQISRI